MRNLDALTNGALSGCMCMVAASHSFETLQHMAKSDSDANDNMHSTTFRYNLVLKDEEEGRGEGEGEREGERKRLRLFQCCTIDIGTFVFFRIRVRWCDELNHNQLRFIEMFDLQ